MATIGLVWELGADYGHLGRLVAIAKALDMQGHRPVLLLRDVSRANQILGAHDFEFLQAPVWLPSIGGLPPALDFSESLFRFGYLDPDSLLSQVKAWDALFSLIRPELLIFDHAPTALLAARGLGVPRLISGNSFLVPPLSIPMPRFAWWEKDRDPARRLASEQRLLVTLNRVLERRELAAIDSVSALYEAEATLIDGYPELDVYPGRTDGRYIGPLSMVDQGASPRWPVGDSPRLFAYLKPGYAELENVLLALKRIPARSLVFVPGIASAVARRFEGPNLSFSSVPLKMSEVRDQCDFAVCHAGGGTVDALLGAGRPLLMLPLQMEQLMRARRVEALGCGLSVLDGKNVAVLEKAMKRLMNSREMLEKANCFKERNLNLNEQLSIRTMIEVCEDLLRGGEAKLLAT